MFGNEYIVNTFPNIIKVDKKQKTKRNLDD